METAFVLESAASHIDPAIYDRKEFDIAAFDNAEAFKLGEDVYITPLPPSQCQVRFKVYAEINTFRNYEIRQMTDIVNNLRQSWQITKQEMLRIMADIPPTGLNLDTWRTQRSELMQLLYAALPCREPIMIQMALIRRFMGPERKFTDAETRWMLENCYTSIRSRDWTCIQRRLLTCPLLTESQALATTAPTIKRWWSNQLRKSMLMMFAEGQ